MQQKCLLTIFLLICTKIKCKNLCILLESASVLVCIKLKRIFLMIHFKDLKYDELRVFNEGNVQYCTPVLAFQSELNLEINGGNFKGKKETMKELTESQKFPLYCAFDLPNGVYSAFLFKICTVQEALFNIKISHFEYKGINPSLSAMKIPLENCPFDETLPVPNNHNHLITDVGINLNTECIHLESLISCQINEVGMRRDKSSITEALNFNFPKYLYN